MLPGMINKATHQLRIAILVELIGVIAWQKILAYDIDQHTDKATGHSTIIVITQPDDTLNTMVRDILDASGLHLNEDQIKQVKDKFLEGNAPMIERDGVLSPKQRLDISTAIQLAMVFKQLNDSGVRVIATLRLDNRNGTPAEVCFIDITDAQTLDVPENCLGVTIPDAQYIFMEITSFPDSIARERTFYNVFQENSGWRTVYGGKGDDYIVQRCIVDTLCHEDTHILTMQMIGTPAFSKGFWADPLLSKYAGYRHRHKIVGELGAYLGEISYTEEPLLILETLFHYAEDSGFIYRHVPQEYVYTGQIVKLLFGQKLGYLDYLISREETKQGNGNSLDSSAKQKERIRNAITKKYNRGDCFSINLKPGEETSKWVEFINSIPNEKLRQAAADIYADKYPGMPIPNLTSIKLPDSVLENYRRMKPQYLSNMFSEKSVPSAVRSKDVRVRAIVAAHSPLATDQIKELYKDVSADIAVEQMAAEWQYIGDQGYFRIAAKPGFHLADPNIRNTAFWKFVLASLQKREQFKRAAISKDTLHQLEANNRALRTLKEVTTLPAGDLEKDCLAVLKEASQIRTD
jgi:hypothetical protein